MLPENGGDDDDDNDDYSFGRGILGRRKYNRSNFSAPSKNSPSDHAITKNGISKDDKALYLHQALSKALPTILSDATSEISLRLGEHRLENLRENIVSQKLRSLVHAWKYELELRNVWRKRLRAHNIHSERERKIAVLKLWRQYFSMRSSKRRWHKKMVSRADMLAKERLFASWNCVKRQFRRLVWIIERRSYFTLRQFLQTWKDLSILERYWKLIVERGTSSRLNKLARFCFHGMISAVRSSNAFSKTTGLVLKCRRYDVYPAFRHWKERSRYFLGLEISASKIELQRSRDCLSRHLSNWLDGLRYSRRLRVTEASLTQLTATRSTLLIVAHWNHTVRVVRWIEHCAETISSRRYRRLKLLMWTTFRSFLRFRKQMVLSIDKLITRQKRNALIDHFHALYNSLLAQRRRVRALRMRDIFFINRFYGYLLDWASRAKRSRRFQTFTMHVTRTCNKSATSIQSHLDMWKKRSSEYWIAWRKVDKLRNRAADQVKALFFLSWLRDWKIKCNFWIFLKRFQMKKIHDFFFIWAEVVDSVLLRMQKIQQGIERLNNRQQYLIITSALHFWHLKLFLRLKVKQLALRKYECHQQKVCTLVKTLIVLWSHISKMRRDRQIKLSGQDSDRQLRAISSSFHIWHTNVHNTKSLVRKGTLLEHISMKNRLKLAFWNLEYYSQGMQKRRAVFERNANRAEHQVCRIHFERWSMFRDRCRLLAARVHTFINFKAAKYRTRFAFSIWTDKHARTVAYDRCLLQNFLKTKRAVFEEWSGFVELVQARTREVAVSICREQRKCLVSVFESWKDWHCHVGAVLTRADSKQKNQKNHALSRLFFSWCDESYNASKLQNTVRKIENKFAYQKKAMACVYVEAWRLYCEQRLKQSRGLQSISDRVCKQALKMSFELWRYLNIVCKALESTGEIIVRRMEQSKIKCVFQAWLSFVEKFHAQQRLICVLHFKVTRKHLLFGFNCFVLWLQMNAVQSRARESCFQKARKRVLSETLTFWHHNLVVFQRSAYKLISRAESKSIQFLKLQMLRFWKTECWREKRLIFKIEHWEQKDTKNAFRHWLEFISHVLFRKAKVTQNLWSLQVKALTSFFSAWSLFTVFSKKRRWSLQLFCDKSVTRFCSAAFREFAIVTVLERRRKVIMANLQRSILRQKLIQAGHYILFTTKKSKMLRRQLERGYVKYLSRMVRASWNIWTSKLKAKKQTTAVLAKAGAVLIDMM